jgi:hypothetical protein
MSLSKPNMSFSGGGLRSITHCTGVISGMTKYIEVSRSGTKEPLNELLDNFDIISGNSGGSWFMSLMCYCQDFFDMLNSHQLRPVNYYPHTESCNASDIMDGDARGGWAVRKYHGSDQQGNMDYCKGGGEGRNGLTSSRTPYSGRGDFVCSCPVGSHWVDDATRIRNANGSCRGCKAALTDSSFSGYITRVFENRKNHVVESRGAIWDYLSKIGILDDLYKTWVGPFLYYSGNAWNTSVTNMVFNSGNRDNRPFSKTVSQPLAKINNHCVWASSIMQDCELTKQLNVKVTNPTCCAGKTPEACLSGLADMDSCGFAIPIFFDNKSLISLYAGQGDVSIQYQNNTHIHTYSDMTDLLHITTPPMTRVSHVASISGAAGAAGASSSLIEHVLKNTLNNMSTVVASIVNRIGTIQMISEYVSGKLEETAIAVELNPFKIVGSICETYDDEDTGCEITDALTEHVLMDKLTTRFADGGYFDNTSILFALRTHQEVHGLERFKHLHIQSSTPGDVGTDIGLLFGCDTRDISNKCNSIVNNDYCSPIKCYNYSTYSEGVDLYLEIPECFDKSTTISMVLWRGVYGGSQVQLNYIISTTIEHKSSGIRAGSICNLFIINVVSDDAVFPLPGTSDTEQQSYVDTAVEIQCLVSRMFIDNPVIYDNLVTNNVEFYDWLQPVVDKFNQTGTTVLTECR